MGTDIGGQERIGTTPFAPGHVAPERRPQFAIVGRGFSGMMVAIALLRRLKAPFDLCLFDPNPLMEIGETLTGPADFEILNSRVRDLSLDPDDSGDFARWLQEDEDFRRLVPAAIPGFEHLFVPKSVFRRYVMDRFARSLAARTDVHMRVSNAWVRDAWLTGEGITLALENAPETEAEASHLILATGFGINGRHRAGSRQEEPRDSVVIVGGGIRAIDRLLCLREKGFAGRITLVSPNRFLPESHTLLAAGPLEKPLALTGNLKALVRALRAAAAEAEAAGKGWQSVFNALRPEAATLWSGLSITERQRFIRHILPVYESHRNRLPPTHSQRLRQELQNPATRHVAGRIIGQDSTGYILEPRGTGGREHITADCLFDDRSPPSDLSSGLIQALIRRGLAVADDLGLGLSVTRGGGLQTDQGASSRLAAIGPLLLGTLPDSDLAHTIVAQAFTLAQTIAEGGARAPHANAGLTQ